MHNFSYIIFLFYIKYAVFFKYSREDVLQADAVQLGVSASFADVYFCKCAIWLLAEFSKTCRTVHIYLFVLASEFEERFNSSKTVSVTKPFCFSHRYTNYPSKY